MKVKNYDVVVAFLVNGQAEVELIGTVDQSPEDETAAVFDIRLTEASKEQLAGTPLGSIGETITGLFNQFDLGHQIAAFQDELRKALEPIKPLDNLRSLVFDSDIYLTELVFRTGDEIRVGLMIRETGQVGPVTFERAAVDVQIDLKEEDEPPA